MAAAWSDNAYSVNLAQIALMLPIGTAVPQPRQRIGTTRISQKRRERPGRAIAAVGYPRVTH